MNNDLIKQNNGPFSFECSNFDTAYKYAKLISDTEMVPSCYRGKPNETLVAINMGAEVGLKPMQALQNISVINGRPTIWGDAILAIVKAHPEFESINESVVDNVASCIIKRKNEPEVIRTFSKNDAEIAGLWGKNTWAKYPERMLQMRARGFACRDSFPDALKGFQVAEEVQDMNVNKKSVKSAQSAIDDITSKRQMNVLDVKQDVDCSTGEVLGGDFADNDKLYFTNDHIIDKINECDTLQMLTEIKDDMKVKLTEQQMPKAKEAYIKKYKELNESTSDVELPTDIDKLKQFEEEKRMENLGELEGEIYKSKYPPEDINDFLVRNNLKDIKHLTIEQISRLRSAIKNYTM